MSMLVGDCRTLLPQVPDASVDMVFADPPFGVGYETGHYENSPHRAIPGDERPDATWVADAARILKDCGCLYMFTRWDVEGFWQEAIRAAGLALKNSIVWVKPDWTSGDLNGAYAYQHERILFAVKGRHLPRWEKRDTDVWHEGHLFSRAHRSHPTEKPFALCKRVILRGTDAGDLVVDPFAGSGTSLCAAKALGRRFLGMEIDPGWAAIAERRLAAVTVEMWQ